MAPCNLLTAMELPWFPVESVQIFGENSVQVSSWYFLVLGLAAMTLAASAPRRTWGGASGNCTQV